MDDIIRTFNMLDYGQSQKEKSLSAIQDQLNRLEIQQQERKLTDNDFGSVNSHKREFFVHFEAINRLFAALQPRLDKIAKEINRISRSTQEWQRADEYHQYILSRLATMHEKDTQVAKNGAEADDRMNRLLPREAEENLANNKGEPAGQDETGGTK